MATRRISASHKSQKPIPPKAPPVVAPGVTAAVHSALDAASNADSASSGKSTKRRAGAKKGQTLISSTPVPTVSEDQRRGMIALSAYLRAERRGFSPEGQAEDWLAAEKEVDALLNSGHTASQ